MKTKTPAIEIPYTTPEHPLPWRIRSEGWRANCDIIAADGTIVKREVNPAVAERIVCAVNSHQALVEALDQLRAWCEIEGHRNGLVRDARAALALANGLPAQPEKGA